ncbi:MAG: Abi-alpha family protein [Caulobacteraceae bacterium]
MSDPSPVRLNVEAKDATVRVVVDAVLDVFSGPTELLGWLGDSIRVHRTRSALKCFHRMKALADEAGVKLTSPPAKFLVQHIEGCSLEDEDDETLVEWWARLLLDASTKYVDQHAHFANVLKNLSALELELLECLVRNGRWDYPIALVEEAEFVTDFEFLEDDLKLTSSSTNGAIDEAIESIICSFERAGSLVLSVFVDDEQVNQWSVDHPDFHENELRSWQILQSLQLVRLSYLKWKSGEVHYRARMVTLTELGAHFYFSCHEKGLQKASSPDVRFTRTRSLIQRQSEEE